MTATSSSKLFTSRRAEPDHPLYWEAGSLRLWAVRTRHEWHIATARQEEKGAASLSASEPLPAKPSWNRWAFTEASAEITATPVMPDKPLVIRPDAPIRIPQGNEVIFFVSIPVWLRLRAEADTEAAAAPVLTEESTMVLSKTWFGEPTMGELCYALRTSASRNLDGIRKGDHRCVCPLRLRNDSDHELHFQKLCIRTLHVNIFEGATRLWSEEIRVSFRGRDQGSEISFGSGPPNYESVGAKLGEAREAAPKSFIRRSFGSLLMF